MFWNMLEWLAEGRIHLTGLRLLAPLLKRGKAVELLEAASGKTKREIEELVARLDPKSDVPDRVRKRPAPARRPVRRSGSSAPAAACYACRAHRGRPTQRPGRDLPRVAVRPVGILAVARRLSRIGYSLETPSWRQVAEHFLLVLCDTVLHTEAFDADEA